MINRVYEVIEGRNSGGMRYVGPFKLLLLSLEQHPILGFGPGTREMVYKKLAKGIVITENIDSTIPRIGIEIGVIGIVLWLMFIFYLINKDSLNNKYYYAITIFILVQLFNGDQFLSSVYWPFLYFLNCKIIPSDKESI